MKEFHITINARRFHRVGVTRALRHLPLICVFALMASAFGAESDADSEAASKKVRAAALKTYKEEIAPFVANYCTRCHGEKKKKGGVTLEYAVKKPEVTSFRTLWKQAATVVFAKDMPPEDEEKQPTDVERKKFVDWIAAMKHLSVKDPGEFVIRRLSKREYGNTLHDLFGVDPHLVDELPDEIFGAGYTNTFSPLLMEQYLAIANDVLNKSFAPAGAPPTAIQNQLLGSPLAAGTDSRAAAREVARLLARKAYRRPATEAELKVLLQVFTLATEHGRSYPDAMRLMLKAVLVSPQFLFITPGTGSEVESTREIVPLDDYQLASRLSYLLWATMPDAELSALADSGKLHDPTVLAVQTRRLLNDPRSRALFDGFGAQWLGLDKLAGKTFDATKFPQMTPALRTAMYDEARLLFENIVHENRSLITFIDCDYSFVNGTLAPFYGMESTVSGTEMRKVQLTNANRGGILTLPGILATSSFPNRTSPVNRGVWVLEQVLGEHVPPPPPNVPTLEKQDKKKTASLTLRQRTELHRTNPVCASCHKVLDPIGFGLENFDAIGLWREKDDSGGAIDATGELPGNHRFSTPKDLKQIISARTEDLCRNLANKLLAYALCRQVEGYDELVVDDIVAAVAKDGNRMQTLVVSVVTSYPFTHRRINYPGELSHAK